MSRAEVFCNKQRYRVVVRALKRPDLTCQLGECRINNQTWICRKNTDGTWTALGRKAVPLGRRA